jgi:pimeloyl-ACP methyl ester carboxylesterase/DNA-binding CsgD family transcriptional regulator
VRSVPDSGWPMNRSATQVRFCHAADGVQLAWEKFGHGAPIVRAAYWLTHIEHDWRSIIWRPWLEAFAKRATLIRYDQRGCGLSDRNVADISFDAWLHDLETVVDAAGVARFTLMGMSQGAAIAIAYAVRHPERVARLIIYGGFFQGRRRRGQPEQVEEADLHERAIRLGWGRENPAFRQIFTSQFMANASAEQLAAWDEMQRLSCSAETAARIVTNTHLIDVADLLPQVRVPTLVMHSTHDARVPFEQGRKLASLIPGARFVALESAGHTLHPREPAFSSFFDQVSAFIAADESAVRPQLAGLTARELELLEQLARGHSNEQIAETLCISQKTVRNVVSLLFDKLDVPTRAAAIVKAREAGFGTSGRSA